MADTHEEQLLSTLLRQIGDADRAAATPAIVALEARVLASCDAAASARSRLWKPVVVAGLAAALVMAISGGWFSHERAVPVSATFPAATMSPVERAVAASPPVRPVPAQAPAPRRARVTRRQSTLAQSSTLAPSPITQSPMEFLPLGPLTEQDLAGPFQLVQVQMPAASLGGLASPLQHPGELVKADVLLSEDGVARGIRMASDESNYPWRLR